MNKNSIDKLKSNDLRNPVFKNYILKDEDFLNLGLYLNLSIKDKEKFGRLIEMDTKILKNKKLTDYSLLLFINEYNKEHYDIYNSNRVMKSFDNKFIYTFKSLFYK